jgi:Zn finger protein HypA/HybF involved in hydrogenase expression
MSLMVKCKECEQTFPSKIQMLDTSKWHRSILINEINQECPNCKKNFLTLKKITFSYKTNL